MNSLTPARIARLPRKYRHVQPRGDRWIALCFLIGICFWGGLWWCVR